MVGFTNFPFLHVANLVLWHSFLGEETIIPTLVASFSLIGCLLILYSWGARSRLNTHVHAYECLVWVSSEASFLAAYGHEGHGALIACAYLVGTRWTHFVIAQDEGEWAPQSRGWMDWVAGTGRGQHEFYL